MKRFLLGFVCLISLTSIASAASLFDKNNEVVVKEKEDARITYETMDIERRSREIANSEKGLYKELNRQVENNKYPQRTKMFIDLNEQMKQDIARANDEPVPAKARVNVKNKKELRDYMYETYSTGMYDELIGSIEMKAEEDRKALQ